MMDVGRGITKDRRTIYIYISIYLSHSHSLYPFMWASLRLAPIPYSGKFSRVLIFAVFADQGESAKFYTSKISRYTV